MPAINVTDQTFQETLDRTTTPVVLDFWATWCGPCITLSKTLEAVADELAGKITILKINVEDNPEVATTFGARSLPYLVFLKDGKSVAQMPGNPSRDKLKKAIADHLG